LDLRLAVRPVFGEPWAGAARWSRRPRGWFFRYHEWMRFCPVLVLMLLALAASPASCGDDVAVFGGQAAAGGAGGGGGAGATGGSTSTSSGTTTTSECGDGICQGDETPGSCPADCDPGSGCAHSPCEVGDPLAQGCEACVDTVCAEDPYCCSDYWDNQCIAEADQLCGTDCCGNGDCEGQTCDACPADCGECVCGDDNCEGEDCSTCADDCGVCPSCPHSVCSAAGPLSTNDCREACVAQVCAQQASCCGGGNESGWSVPCQELAISLCGVDPCVQAVCNAQPSCCSSGWNQSCVNQAESLCSTQCNCAHSLCDSGGALSPSCDPCVAAVCQADPYCCDSDWDGVCVGEVGSVCGIVCP